MKKNKFLLKIVSEKYMFKRPSSLFFRSAIVFIFFFSLFLSAHYLSNSFTGSDDPYYHSKHAFLIERSGNLTLVEPWLEFHFFNYAPADPWWGFHLGLALFIHFFGLFLGVKIFVSLLAALGFLVFYWVLSKLEIKYPLVWTLFLFFSSTIFSNRLFLERPHLLSLIIFPLVFLLLVKSKNLWLFVLALFYALCYDLAPLIILPALVYAVADFYSNRQINLKPLIASAGGVLAGIIIHPASLNYFYVIFSQLGQTFFLKFTGVNLNIGSESQLIGFFEFLKSNLLVLLFYILATVLFLSLKKNSKNLVVSNFLFLCASFWFLVTLLIPRGVEYWLPAAFLFTAVIFNDFLKTEEFKQIKNWLTNRINIKVAGFFLISIVAIIIFNNLINTFCYLYFNNTGERAANYEQANLWLKANTERGSVVFYDNWSMWPLMFFYNDYNHYIAGIDPTFLYEYDPRTYWLWRNLSARGLYCDKPDLCLNLSPREQIRLVPVTIKTVFRAKYAVVGNYEASNLIKTLNSLKTQTRLVFKNKDLLIYEMK